MTTPETLAAARAYLDDRRIPLPTAHQLAVALCDTADEVDRLRVMWIVEKKRADREDMMEVSTWNDEHRWYVRLMKLAHEMAMQGRGQEAQDLRVAATHARNYRWLRDHSSPERDLYYLCSDRTQARFNDPSAVDRHVETDIANYEAKQRATGA